MSSRPSSAQSESRSPFTDSRHAARQLRKDALISFLALVSVGIGAYDFTHPRINDRFTPLDGLDLFIVLVFIVDFVLSAHRSGDWRLYARRHWYEIPSLLPITSSMAKGAEAVPLLRGLRLVRLVRVLRLLRVAGALPRLRQAWTTSVRVARRAHLPGLALVAGLFVLAGAALSWLFEGPGDAHFRGGESIWWAVNMFSNVAYVDFQPKTTAGRVVAGILEFSGIGFIGLFTASLASALLTDKEEERPEEPPLD